MRCILYDACVKLGFCGGGHTADIHDMLENVPVDSAKFAQMMLVFEGCEQDHHCKTDLQNLFSEAFENRFDPKLTENERTALGLH